MKQKITFNYSKLRGKIREKFGNESDFAKELGCNSSTLSFKLNSLNDFTQSEIFKSIHILGLDESDISSYFFTENV